MGNSLAKILGASILGAGLLFSPVKNASADEFYFYKGLGLNISVIGASAKVDTVPEYARTLPPHLEDIETYELNPNPIAIPDAPLSLGLIEKISIEAKFGVGVKSNDFYFETGPAFNFSWSGVDGLNKFNYYPGGYDAYLYSGLAEGNQDSRKGVSLGWSARALTPLLGSKKCGFSFFFEYLLEWKEFFLETGWDRYNLLETKDTFKLADSLNSSFAIGFSMNNTIINPFAERVELFVGATVPYLFNKTRLAQESNLSVEPGIYIIGRCGTDFNFMK